MTRRHRALLLTIVVAAYGAVAEEPWLGCSLREQPDARSAEINRGPSIWAVGGRAPTTVYYRILPPSDPTLASIAEREIERALAEWRRHIAVEFVRTDSDVGRTITFAFGADQHACPYRFGGSLAHAFYPAPHVMEPLAGDVHFHVEKDWVSRYSLFSVALHEIGHALGLDHINEVGAVMTPVYRKVDRLDWLDIAAAWQIYQGLAKPPSLIEHRP